MIYGIRVTGRETEWTISIAATGFGIWLIWPMPSMDGAAFSVLTNWAPEPQWGLLFFLTGISHVVALVINGRAAWTAWVRAGCAALNFMTYVMLAAGFWVLDPATTGVYSYSIFAAMALAAWVRAIRDGFRRSAGHHA